jgi:hypothetical protein
MHKYCMHIQCMKSECNGKYMYLLVDGHICPIDVASAGMFERL